MVEVTRASIDRVPELASLIGRAFADDPNALWSLGPAATPEQVIQWFEAPDRIVAQEGLLWEAGHALGAALWFPPGTEDPYRDYDRESRRVIKVLADEWRYPRLVVLGLDRGAPSFGTALVPGLHRRASRPAWEGYRPGLDRHRAPRSEGGRRARVPRNCEARERAEV